MLIFCRIQLVSDPAFMGCCRERAGPEVGAPVAVSGCAPGRHSHRIDEDDLNSIVLVRGSWGTGARAVPARSTLLGRGGLEHS